MSEETTDDDDDLPRGHDALAKAHAAKPAELATMRSELEWATTQNDDPALWLALGVVYLRLGDRASAETTLRHAEQRAAGSDGKKPQLATAIEVTAALDATRGAPTFFDGSGILRAGPKRRLYVELPDASYRWAALRVGDLLRAGVTPKAGEPIACRARLGRRGWEVIGIKSTGQSPKGTLGKDGTYVRCGELRFLPLVEPCPPDQLRWDNEAWRTQVTNLPLKTGNDRKTHVAWKELGVAGWAELATKLAAVEAGTAPASDETLGKLSQKGKHLVVGGVAREIVESDVCEPAARRGRYASWRAIADAVPFLVEDRKVKVDWPALSQRHALEPAVESWPALAAVLDARPPPPKRASNESLSEPAAPAEQPELQADADGKDPAESPERPVVVGEGDAADVDAEKRADEPQG